MVRWYSHLPVTVLRDWCAKGEQNREHIISFNDVWRFDLPFNDAGRMEEMCAALRRTEPSVYLYSPLHTHERMEILYFLEGQGNVYVDGVLIPVAAGDVVLINPYQPHALFASSDTPFDRAVLSVSTTYLRQITFYDSVNTMYQNGRQFASALGSDPVLRENLDEILAAVAEKQTGFAYAVLGGLCKSIAYLLSADRTVEAAVQNAQEMHFREETERLIIAHFREEYTCSAAAAEMNYSREHFCRLFRACYHTTFTQYINAFRIHQARLRLHIDPEQSITRLSTDLGFNDSGYFTRVFRKITGTSPSAYADTCRKRAEIYEEPALWMHSESSP